MANLSKTIRAEVELTFTAHRESVSLERKEQLSLLLAALLEAIKAEGELRSVSSMVQESTTKNFVANGFSAINLDTSQASLSGSSIRTDGSALNSIAEEKIRMYSNAKNEWRPGLCYGCQEQHPFVDADGTVVCKKAIENPEVMAVGKYNQRVHHAGRHPGRHRRSGRGYGQGGRSTSGRAGCGG